MDQDRIGGLIAGLTLVRRRYGVGAYLRALRQARLAIGQVVIEYGGEKPRRRTNGDSVVVLFPSDRER